MRIDHRVTIGLILALVLLLSGCSGFISSKTNTASSTQTLSEPEVSPISEDEYQNTVTNTDAKTNNSDKKKEPPEYPQLVSNNQSVSESELLEEHINQLIDRKGTIQSEHRQISFWRTNNTEFVNGVVKAKGNQTEYYNIVNASSFYSTGYYWENETVGYVRNVPFRDWVYKEPWNGKYDDPHQTFASVSYTDRLRWLVINLEIEPIQRGYTESDEPRILFKNVNQGASVKFTNKMLMDQLTNFSLRLATRPDGRITNATWRLNGTYNGEPVNRTETWKYEYGVNVSTRPDWLDTAREEAQEIEVTHPTNITYKIEHLGDKTVPAGARIAVLTPTATTHITFDQPFEPTDVVYIAAPNESLETYRTRPSGDEFQPLPSRVSIGILIGPANAMGDSHPESFRWREFLVEEAD